MPFIVVYKNSPFYWLGFYNKEESDPKKRRTVLNTKIKVTDADWKKYKVWKAEVERLKAEGNKRPAIKQNLQGNKELRDTLKKFTIALAERDMYAKAGLPLKITKTLSAGLEDYLFNHPKLKDKTIESYHNAMDLFIKVIGNKDINKCTGNDCSKFIHHLIKEEYSEATQNSYTKRLWVIFNYFISKKWINDNIIVITSVPEYFPEPIPEDDLKRIITYYSNKKDYTTPQLAKPNKTVPQVSLIKQNLFIRLMLETGFRQSTLFELKPSSFDIDQKRIKAINVKRNSKAFYFPIHKRIMEIIPELLKILPFDYKSTQSLDFWRRDMTLLYRDGHIRDRYQLYQLRDTFNSRLANEGIDESTRNELMDHYDSSINRRHYTKYHSSYLIKVLDKALKGKV